MSVWDWVGTIGAIWLAVSFVVAIGWVLSGKRVFRKPPTPPGYAEFEREHELECLSCIKLDEEMRRRK